MAVFLTQDETTTQENVTRTLVKKMLASAKLPLTKAVNIMNQMHPDNATTPQNINNKLTADSIKFIEVARLADICGYQVIFRPKDAVNWADETPAKSAPHRIPKEKDPEEDKPVKAEHKVSRNKPAEKDIKVSYASLLARGYAVCKSINLQGIMIAGKKAEEAAAWIESKINPEMDEMEEMVVIVNANHQFQVLAKPLDGIDEQFSLFAEY